VIKVSQGCPEELKNLWFAFDDEQRFVGVGKTEQDALRNLESAARTLKRSESPTQNAE
jgi:predicted RNase H-like HicB family nuclease